MSNHNEEKDIISHFLKISPSDIDESTIIDHTVISSSLLLHRMYAVLADKGFVIDDPASIKTYGDFVKNISHEKEIFSDEDNIEELDFNTPNESFFSIGIDIEEIANFDAVDNYKDDSFYKNNFSIEEMDYCISKTDTRRSFAGLFSLKEAIIKADNSYKKIPFNKIEIKHTKSGGPIFNQFSISLSHSDNYVVAVASKLSDSIINNKESHLLELEGYMENVIQKKLFKNNIFFVVLTIFFCIFLLISMDFYDSY
jgi:phosphopantetheine--protein transferase-like protein